MTFDPGSHRALQAALAGLRPEGGAPATLRARVLEIPSRIGAEPAWQRVVRRFRVPVAAAGVATAAVALAAVSMTRAPIVDLPPASGGGATVGFDPAIEGPGLITAILPSATVVGLLLVVVGVAMALGTFLSIAAGTNRGRLLVLAGLVTVGAGTVVITFDGGLTAGSFRAAPLGYVEAPSPPFQDEIVWMQTAGPGEPTVALFSLRNTSSVPVQIEGIVVGDQYETLAVGHLTALWMPLSGAGFSAPGLEETRPFEPVTLNPGDELNVYAAGRAGPCAYGPTINPADEFANDDLAGYSSFGPQVTVAFSVFGLVSTTVVDIGETFAEPSRNSCMSPGTLN